MNEPKCRECNGTRWVQVDPLDDRTVQKCPSCNRSATSRRNDPATSKRAALAAYPRQGSWQMRALEVFVAHPEGLTDYELALKLNRPMHRGSVAKYRIALVRSGWVEDSGHTRPTDTGSDAIVWMPTAAAKRYRKRGAA